MKKDDSRKFDEELAWFSTVRDEDIDFSNIPEIRNLEGAIGGKFYRPLKRHITMRIDEDILTWVKARPPKYQTAINNVLREYMLAKLSA